MPELNDKQRRFAAEYLVDLNATQAAIRAGYSKKTAAEQGYDLLRKPQIAALVQQKQSSLAQKFEVTAEQVIREYAAIAFADMRHFLKFTPDGGAYLDWQNMPPEATKAIAEITQEEFMDGHGDDARPVRRTKFKLHSKTTALHDLADHLGLFAKKPEAPQNNTFNVLITDLKGNERHVTSLREFYALTAVPNPPPPVLDGPAGRDAPAPEPQQARNGRAKRR